MLLTREEAAELLEVEVDADETTVKSAYKRLALKWHPDKNPGNEDEASEQFKRVFAAHQRMLRDTDDSQEEDDWDEDDYEAAMEEALAFFTFIMQRAGGLPPGIRVHMMEGDDGEMGFGFALGGQGGMGGIGGLGGMPMGGMGGFDDGGYRGMPSGNMGIDGFATGGHPGIGMGRRERRQMERKMDARDEQTKRNSEARRRQQSAKEEKAARRASDVQAAREAAKEEREQQRRQKRDPEQAKRDHEALMAKARAEMAASMGKPNRPTMREKTETSLTMALSRDGKKAFNDQTWTLECRAAGEASWRVAVAATPEHLVTVPDLKPGTKYSFRSRTSVPEGGEPVWSEYSVESMYPTAGHSGAAAAAATNGAVPAPPGQQQRSGRRRKGEGKAARKGSAEQPAPSPEELVAAELERMQVQKAKDKAIQAALAAAEADYEVDRQKAARRAQPANVKKEPAAARPKPPPGRRHVAPGQQQQHGVVSITEELAHAPPANRPARSRGFVLNPMGPPPAGVSVAEWQHELELEEARQLSLALEASKRECAGLPSEDLTQASVEARRREKQPAAPPPAYEPYGRGGGGGGGRECFTCGQLGHIARDCPSRPTAYDNGAPLPEYNGSTGESGWDPQPAAQGDEWQPDWGTSQQQEQPPQQVTPPPPAAAADEWQHTWNQDGGAAQQQECWSPEQDSAATHYSPAPAAQLNPHANDWQDAPEATPVMQPAEDNQMWALWEAPEQPANPAAGWEDPSAAAPTPQQQQPAAGWGAPGGLAPPPQQQQPAAAWDAAEYHQPTPEQPSWGVTHDASTTGPPHATSWDPTPQPQQHQQQQEEVGGLAWESSNSHQQPPNSYQAPTADVFPDPPTHSQQPAAANGWGATDQGSYATAAAAAADPDWGEEATGGWGYEDEGPAQAKQFKATGAVARPQEDFHRYVQRDSASEPRTQVVRPPPIARPPPISRPYQQQQQQHQHLFPPAA